MIPSGHKFAHATAAELSWHVQNCDLLRSLELGSKQKVVFFLQNLVIGLKLFMKLVSVWSRYDKGGNTWNRRIAAGLTRKLKLAEINENWIDIDAEAEVARRCCWLIDPWEMCL